MIAYYTSGGGGGSGMHDKENLGEFRNGFYATTVSCFLPKVAVLLGLLRMHINPAKYFVHIIS